MTTILTILQLFGMKVTSAEYFTSFHTLLNSSNLMHWILSAKNTRYWQVLHRYIQAKDQKHFLLQLQSTSKQIVSDNKYI